MRWPSPRGRDRKRRKHEKGSLAHYKYRGSVFRSRKWAEGGKKGKRGWERGDGNGYSLTLLCLRVMQSWILRLATRKEIFNQNK